MLYFQSCPVELSNERRRVCGTATCLMCDQTEEDGLKIEGHARGVVCVWFRDRKIEGRERAAVCPSSCNKSCLFCYTLHWPRCVLIDTSRQKDWGGTGIKLCIGSERQICLDFCPESCLI